MNTRKNDLDELEEARDRNPLLGKILDKVYKQSQDPEVERLRRMLIEAHKRKDFATIDKIEIELARRR